MENAEKHWFIQKALLQVVIYPIAAGGDRGMDRHPRLWHCSKPQVPTALASTTL